MGGGLHLRPCLYVCVCAPVRERERERRGNAGESWGAGEAARIVNNSSAAARVKIYHPPSHPLTRSPHHPITPPPIGAATPHTTSLVHTARCSVAPLMSQFRAFARRPLFISQARVFATYLPALPRARTHTPPAHAIKM
jgi:hypothetical protein